ncbi:MAG: thiol-disulfide oxidoreductase DCC family protein [Candidatus Limnocylindrales bacterium]
MATEMLARPQPADEEPTPRLNCLTVLYDDDCRVCRETVRQLGRWDREDRFEFLPLQRAASSGRPLLERLAAEGHLPDAIHVVDESTGRVVSGGHAALAILDGLPGGWLLRPWAALAPTALAVDVVYRVAARHRDRLAWLMGMRDEVTCRCGHRLQSVTAPPDSEQSCAADRADDSFG